MRSPFGRPAAVPLCFAVDPASLKGLVVALSPVHRDTERETRTHCRLGVPNLLSPGPDGRFTSPYCKTHGKLLWSNVVETIWFQPKSVIHLNRPETAASLGWAAGNFGGKQVRLRDSLPSKCSWGPADCKYISRISGSRLPLAIAGFTHTSAPKGNKV